MNAPHETETRSLQLKSSYREVEKLHDFLRTTTREILGKSTDPDRIGVIVLAVHEVFTNIIRHAYPESDEKDVWLHCTPSCDGVMVEIVDHGVEFNPLDTENLFHHSVLEEVKNLEDLAKFEECQLAGGYGIPILQAAATHTTYRRSESGDNHLYLYFENQP